MADRMANVSDGTSRLRSSLCFTLMTLMMKLYHNFSVHKDNHLSCSTTVIQKLGQRMSVISHIQQIISEPSHQQQECSLEKNSSLRSDKQQKWKPCQDSTHTKIGRHAASAQVVKHHTAWNAPKIGNICVQKLWFPVTCLCFLMKRTAFLLTYNKFFFVLVGTLFMEIWFVLIWFCVIEMFWCFMKISKVVRTSASQVGVTVNIWEHNLPNWGLIISD